MANTKKTTLDITGMTCAACSNRIEKKLNKLDDVNAQVNLTTEKATVEYNPDQHDVQEFINTIQHLGYGVAVETVELDITGMTCAACSSRIEKVLNKMDGVQNATVNLTTEQAKVDYYPEETDADKLVTRIQKLGYDASIKDNNKDQTSRKAEALQHK
ncbi:TPA: copper ion binding protein, partial [Staphylococcus aureus]|nr:copper ion binding protein [Staphylococcus aureus]